jgi:hypothetical protein
MQPPRRRRNPRHRRRNPSQQRTRCRIRLRPVEQTLRMGRSRARCLRLLPDSHCAHTKPSASTSPIQQPPKPNMAAPLTGALNPSNPATSSSTALHPHPRQRPRRNRHQRHPMDHRPQIRRRHLPTPIPFNKIQTVRRLAIQ